MHHINIANGPMFYESLEYILFLNERVFLKISKNTLLMHTFENVSNDSKGIPVSLHCNVTAPHVRNPDTEMQYTLCHFARSG